MMSEKYIKRDNYECNKPECGSTEFTELRTTARVKVVVNGSINQIVHQQHPREEKDIWGFVCVFCGTVADERLRQALLESLD